jgi:hypothetical protein
MVVGERSVLAWFNFLLKPTYKKMIELAALVNLGVAVQDVE